MKRKRRYVKPKPKKLSVAADVVVDPQYYSDVNEDNDNVDSRVEILARGSSSRMSDRRVGLGKPAVNNERAGSAAAKLARIIDSSRAKATSGGVAVHHDRIDEKEGKSSQPAPGYNKQELEAALAVIKKIMKMNGAATFNSPVDPIALSIPDYFDIIDMPMDFGTICSNLEKGLEYRNSEDVFKDVQRIWDNCCTYNNKGSTILELMKRVKNNFMKQWTAAGLYKEQQTVSNGHLPHSPEIFADSTIRREEVMHVYPVGSTLSRCADLHRHDFSCLNKMQHQTLSPCCGGTFKPHQVSRQLPCSLPPGKSLHGHHQLDLASHSNHHRHLQSVDLMNDKLCNHRVNKVSPDLMRSYQPSSSCCLMEHSQERTCLHQSTSSKLPPFQLQTDINARSAGQTAGDNNYQQHQIGPVRVHADQPFTNCMHAHQFNQNTCQKLRNSRTEDGRQTGFAVENPDVPPPAESTINCTKRSTGCSTAPLTGNSSCQQLSQINSNPEQSPSIINIKTCHSPQQEPSPSEHLHSTSYINFSKNETQGQGLAQCQEQSSSMRNSQESEPVQKTCQKASFLQSKLSLLTADCNMKSKKKPRGRGPARCLEYREGERISVTTNAQGQPVGPEARKLTTFLGTLARNGYFLPLTYNDWRAVPSEYKENVWHEVQLRFEIDPICKDFAMHSVGKSWKNWKCLLKTAHYYPHETDEERLADRDQRVPPDQWAVLIAIWNTESVQELSARNKANRLLHNNNHVTGSKSSVRIHEEQRLLREGVKDKGAPQKSNKQSDTLPEIIGPDKNGRTRGIELGLSSSDPQEPTHTEATKTVSEANAEIRDMKEKMTVMEQTCAQMASQMAAMMSMMSSMHGIPDKNISKTSGPSDQSLPRQAPTVPSRGVSSNQANRSKSKI